METADPSAETSLAQEQEAAAGAWGFRLPLGHVSHPLPGEGFFQRLMNHSRKGFPAVLPCLLLPPVLALPTESLCTTPFLFPPFLAFSKPELSSRTSAQPQPSACFPPMPSTAQGQIKANLTTPTQLSLTQDVLGGVRQRPGAEMGNEIPRGLQEGIWVFLLGSLAQGEQKE